MAELFKLARDPVNGFLDHQEEQIGHSEVKGAETPEDTGHAWEIQQELLGAIVEGGES